MSSTHLYTSLAAVQSQIIHTNSSDLLNRAIEQVVELMTKGMVNIWTNAM